ncbi:MAG: CinA family protein [Microbacteriaceae bacterium]|jgi:nicotinamide-nucleotide amidase|nr:CinA family protein [Microbacteriaceae bacterium]MCI1207046.1 CinA family protein [Microbacteriaceae bacterium]
MNGGDGFQGDISLTRQGVIIDRFARLGLHLAVAESLTGGLVAGAFADVPGASRVLQGGIVAYQTSLKHRLLGVDKELLAEHGAVDPQVAEEMALGVRERLAEGVSAATVGVSTTGVAGPDWQDEQPPGTVFIGLAWDTELTHYAHTFRGSRQEIREATVAAVMEHLWEHLDLGLR